MHQLSKLWKEYCCILRSLFGSEYDRMEWDEAAFVQCVQDIFKVKNKFHHNFWFGYNS